MGTPDTARRMAPHLTRRELLKAGLAAGATLSIRPLSRPSLLCAGETAQLKRGGILHVRGFDPPNFDPQLTTSWQPYVQNYAPNLTFDYGSRVAALWLERP